MPRIVSIQTVASVRVNADRTVRERIGRLIRDLADAIDGRLTWAVKIQTNRNLPRAEVASIAFKGIDQAADYMVDALSELCEQESIKIVMQTTYPALYKSEGEKP